MINLQHFFCSQQLIDVDTSNDNIQLFEAKLPVISINGIHLGSAYDAIEEALHYRSVMDTDRYTNLPKLLI